MNYNEISTMVFNNCMRICRIEQVDCYTFEVYCMEYCLDDTAESIRVCNFCTQNMAITDIQSDADTAVDAFVDDIKFDLQRLFTASIILAEINHTSVEIEANRLIYEF